MFTEDYRGTKGKSYLVVVDTRITEKEAVANFLEHLFKQAIVGADTALVNVISINDQGVVATPAVRMETLYFNEDGECTIRKVASAIEEVQSWLDAPYDGEPLFEDCVFLKEYKGRRYNCTFFLLAGEANWKVDKMRLTNKYQIMFGEDAEKLDVGIEKDIWIRDGFEYGGWYKLSIEDQHYVGRCTKITKDRIEITRGFSKISVDVDSPVYQTIKPFKRRKCEFDENDFENLAGRTVMAWLKDFNATSDYSHSCVGSALYVLLDRWGIQNLSESLMGTIEYAEKEGWLSSSKEGFAKKFRQTEITHLLEGTVDMAIRHLINTSRNFDHAYKELLDVYTEDKKISVEWQERIESY